MTSKRVIRVRMSDNMWNAADYMARSLDLDLNEFTAYCIEKYVMDTVEKAQAKSGAKS